MSSQAYQGCTKRTFEQALCHLLETEYSLVGSGRILQLLAQDVKALAETFYPPATRLRPGWMVFTGIKADGPKAYPGQPASDYTLVTIPWPVCLPEDIQRLADAPPAAAGKLARRQLNRQRLVRLVEHGWQHPQGPIVLTLADLSLMVGLNTIEVSQLLAEARQETGESLKTMGYVFDLGQKPTHKAQIVQLYEEGLDEAEIARQSHHAQSSVGRYLRDYERVKLALQRQLSPQEIPSLMDMQPSVVQAYVNLVANYHPDLLPISVLTPIGS